ncbi:MAG: BACON domain-containing protein [bacterium]|nr:BACON domain-containing protein [bacterium]
MKRTALIWATLLLLPALVSAQGGAICLYADPTGTNCGFEDNTPGLLQIYVLHTLATGVSSSQFWLPKPACMVGATFLKDTNVLPVFIGESQTGISIGYGSCVNTIHMLTMNYAVSGTSVPDCAYPVLPHPARYFVEAADCDQNVIAATGGTSYINSSRSCQCEELARPPFLEVSMEGVGFGNMGTTRTFDIRNVGGGQLTWTLTDDQHWITVSPSSGSGDGTITVTADRTWLGAGTHLGTISVESNGGNQTLLVSAVVVGEPRPKGISVGVNPDKMYFERFDNQHTFMIRSYRSNDAIAWEARLSVPWLIVAPANGYANGTESSVTVYVDRTRLGSGLIHETTIVIRAPNGDRLNGNPTIDVHVDGPKEAVTANHNTTWGYVKALYRD